MSVANIQIIYVLDVFSLKWFNPKVILWAELLHFGNYS